GRQVRKRSALDDTESRNDGVLGAQREDSAWCRRMPLDVPIGLVERLPDSVQVRFAVWRARRAIRRGLTRHRDDTQQDGERGCGDERRCAAPGSHGSIPSERSLTKAVSTSAGTTAVGEGKYNRPARAI